MPYIKPVHRDELETRRPASKGELNYLITKLMIDYVKFYGVSYTNASDAIAAANDAAEEFRRRVLNPYEDRVCRDNGDVYETLLSSFPVLAP